MVSPTLFSAFRALPRQSSALRAVRRSYADVADGKLQLSLVLPHQSLYSASGVLQVNLPASTGEMGILANHVPTVEALRPGVVEVIEEAGGQGKKWFVSAGFATMHVNNLLTINAVEAYEMDKFSSEAGPSYRIMFSADLRDNLSPSHPACHRPYIPAQWTRTSQNIRSALADAQRVISSSAPESEKAEARIEVDVFESLQSALAR